MGTKGRILGIVVGLIVAWYVAQRWRPGGKWLINDDPISIEYHGQSVRLSRTYNSYEEYKDDPNNIAPEENARVAKLVTGAPIPKRFATRKQMIDAVFSLEFPGNGLGTGGERPQADGSVLCMDFIDIPRADRYRYLVFRGNAHGYVLIDDFVLPADPRIDDVREQDGKLTYFDHSGKLIASHVPAEK